MKVKIGDIVENGWAGDGNPHKRMIYIGNGKYLCCDGHIAQLAKPCSEYPDRRKVLGNAFVDNWRDILAARDLPEGLANGLD
ncbi:hypothetical protein AAGW04_06980 [Pectobacterium aroidearum]|uniref:hypothetical protein n=1 Tax=Pectobacterium aroidearum TaxID=1201031 RepID=UPI0031597F50